MFSADRTVYSGNFRTEQQQRRRNNDEKQPSELHPPIRGRAVDGDRIQFADNQVSTGVKGAVLQDQNVRGRRETDVVRDAFRKLLFYDRLGTEGQNAGENRRDH